MRKSQSSAKKGRLAEPDSSGSSPAVATEKLAGLLLNVVFQKPGYSAHCWSTVLFYPVKDWLDVVFRAPGDINRLQRLLLEVFDLRAFQIVKECIRNIDAIGFKKTAAPNMMSRYRLSTEDFLVQMFHTGECIIGLNSPLAPAHLGVFNKHCIHTDGTIKDVVVGLYAVARFVKQFNWKKLMNPRFI